MKMKLHLFGIFSLSSSIFLGVTAEPRSAKQQRLERIRRKNPHFKGGKPEPENYGIVASPENGLQSTFLNWERLASQSNDPFYSDPENFLKSRPESGNFCPPKAWIDRFWEYSMAGDEKSPQGFKYLGKIHEFDMAYKHCKLPCTGRQPEWWEKNSLTFDNTVFRITPDMVAEEIERRNCACIACIREAGKWADRHGPYWMFYSRIRHFNLNENEESENAVVYDEEDNWDTCTCGHQLISYWQAQIASILEPACGSPCPGSEPESSAEAYGSTSNSDVEPAAESEPESRPE